MGMETVTQSLNVILSNDENKLYYILAHSASGGYLVRYLLEHSCDSLRAVVFTDSTHRIAWA